MCAKKVSDVNTSFKNEMNISTNKKRMHCMLVYASSSLQIRKDMRQTLSMEGSRRLTMVAKMIIVTQYHFLPPIEELYVVKLFALTAYPKEQANEA